MTSATRLEAFLARLYTDPEICRAFVRDPRGEAARAGLSAPDIERAAGVDVAALTLAAGSFTRKRATKEHHRRRASPWRTWWSRG
jgi:hypothetical protein